MRVESVTTVRRRSGWGALAAMALALGLSACASAPKTPGPAPDRYPEFPALDIPAALNAFPEQRDGIALGWRRLQSGDIRGAGRQFSAMLQAAPAFYPAEAGLGFVALADRAYMQAVTRFRGAIARDEQYLPAWYGLADAHLALEQFDAALRAMERVVAIDPSRESERNRLEMLRLRQMQSMIDAARKARQAGRLDEADSLLTNALAAYPASTTILRELASVELETKHFDDAEAHAQRAVMLDPNDAAALGLLGDVLTARERLREAAAAYDRAAAIDASWKAKAEAVRARLEAVTLPAELRDVSGTATVDRAQLAALVATRFERLIAAAPKKGPQIATDIRGHWAAPFIAQVSQAGVMQVFPNNTFQPSGVVRRADLAEVAAALIAIGAKPDELAKWRAAQPSFADLAPGNAFYPAAALAVATRVLAADPSGRFEPTRPATGAEVVAALARVEAVAVR